MQQNEKSRKTSSKMNTGHMEPTQGLWSDNENRKIFSGKIWRCTLSGNSVQRCPSWYWKTVRVRFFEYDEQEWQTRAGQPATVYEAYHA